MAILPEEICRFNAIPIKISMTFFSEIEKTTLKCMWNHKGPWVAKAILRKSKTGGTTFPDFRIYCKPTVLWGTDTKPDTQSNGTEQRTQKWTHTYTVTWSLTRVPGIHKKSLFNEWCWKDWIFTCRRVKLDPYTIDKTKQNKTPSQNGFKA